MALTAELEASTTRLEHPALWPVLQVRVLVRNDGDEPDRIPTALLAAPLSFELVDDGGRRVPLGPPPVPPQDVGDDARTFAPGEALSLEYHGDELLPDPPPPGRYRLRFAADAVGERVESPWIAIDVGPGS